MTYTPRTFQIPPLEGISEKQVAIHLALYEGYVKHVNLIMEKIQELRGQDAEGNAYLINELRRRLSFEFDGMRMHEYYFEQFEGGVRSPREDSALFVDAKVKYGSTSLTTGGEKGLVGHVKEVAGTRGIGWVVVYHDVPGDTLHTAFVSDHELGQFAGLPIILALDLWEHAYMVDYVPADKKNYIDAFFANVNWNVIEKRYVTAA